MLLLPAGSVAQLDVAVSDARGTELLPSVALELGADDAFPWRPPPNKSATSTTASAQEAGGAFAAASRRRRRRLRGIRLGGLGGLGGLSRGGFTRGSGSFRSPNMGSSMGPRPGGSISSAYGTAGGARFAGGMGGARLPAGGYNPGFGYHPMGYNPGMDIATGMMIGSMLRTPHHHHHSSSQHLHHGQQQQQLDGGNSSFAAASSAYPRGTYLLASNAMKAHTQLKVVRATAPPPRAVSRSALTQHYLALVPTFTLIQLQSNSHPTPTLTQHNST